MQIGRKVIYEGKKWEVVAFFADTLGLSEQKPYGTWVECRINSNPYYTIKAQLYIDRGSYGEYKSVQADNLFSEEINKYYQKLEVKVKIKDTPTISHFDYISEPEPLSEPVKHTWKDSDLVPNPK